MGNSAAGDEEDDEEEKPWFLRNKNGFIKGFVIWPIV